MSTLNRLINREAIRAVAFVTLGFVSLQLFFDFVDELQFIGRFGNNYQLRHALQFALLQVPNHVYELLPITVLIGTVFVMARLAESSEFTILRTSGLGPWRALRQLLGLGLLFSIAALLIGDYLAPAADRRGQLIKAKYQGLMTTGLTGAWLREKQDSGSYTVNVANMGADADMHGVRVFEFDAKGNVVALVRAASARFADTDHWLLSDVQTIRFNLAPTSLADLTNSVRLPVASGAGVTRTTAAEVSWPTEISADMVAAALLKPERMRTFDLYQYMTHLKTNGQDSQRFEIEFWRKVFYPLSCLVMVILALPFAYFHFRSGGITAYVFVGVLIGISFFLLNNMFGFIGNISQWEPWVAAAVPSLFYLVLSLSGFAWLVLRR